MKIGDKVQWLVERGKSAGTGREGEVVAKVKANEDAIEVLENKVKSKRSTLRINTAQATSSHDRVIVRVDATPEPFYLCPRTDKVMVVESANKS